MDFCLFNNSNENKDGETNWNQKKTLCMENEKRKAETDNKKKS